MAKLTNPNQQPRRQYRLVFQLLCCLVFIVSTMMGVLGWLVQKRIYSQQFQQMYSKADAFAESLEYSFETFIELGNAAAVQRVVQNQSTHPEVLELALVAPNGMTLAHTNFKARGKDYLEFKNHDQGLTQLISKVKQSQKPTQQELHWSGFPALVKALPLSGGNFSSQKGRGMVIVALDLRPLKAAQKSETHLFLFTMFLGTSFTILMFWISLHFFALKPLDQLSQAAEQIALKGQFLEPSNLPTNEISLLSKTLAEVFQELEETQIETERLSKVASRTDNSVILTNAERNIEWINDGFTRTTGYTLDEVVGKNPSLLQGPESDPEVVEFMRKQLDNAASFRAQLINYTKSNQKFWAEIEVQPLRNDQGELTHFMAIQSDITKRKEAELVIRNRTVELERSNRDLDDFAYVASHDLRSPLEGVKNLAAWIQEDNADVLSEKSKKHLDQMQQRIYRMEMLLDDLLQYSRAGRIQEEIVETNIGEVLENIITLLNKPKNFTISIVGEVPTLMTAKTPLEQILRNLINNAIKHHNRDDGKVEIFCHDQGEMVEFVVSDDGPGISPKFHNLIFQMFETLRTRDEVEGSGMGLALVKKLIEYHGGQITVESSEKNGATFRFSWPKSIKTGEMIHV